MDVQNSEEITFRITDAEIEQARNQLAGITLPRTYDARLAPDDRRFGDRVTRLDAVAGADAFDVSSLSEGWVENGVMFRQLRGPGEADIRLEGPFVRFQAAIRQAIAMEHALSPLAPLRTVSGILRTRAGRTEDTHHDSSEAELGRNDHATHYYLVSNTGGTRRQPAEFDAGPQPSSFPLPEQCEGQGPVLWPLDAPLTWYLHTGIHWHAAPRASQFEGPRVALLIEFETPYDSYRDHLRGQTDIKPGQRFRAPVMPKI